MAEIVCALGVPHTPFYPALVAREGPECETARLYREVRLHLEAVKPDVLLVFDSDHLNTFFFDNWPTFAIGATPRIEGPNDDIATILPPSVVRGDEQLAGHLYRSSVLGGFDLSLTQSFTIDHSIMVPLHFLTPALNIPIVPFFINGLAPPLPAAKRCFLLGELIRSAIECWPKDVRVAIVASGSFSLEVAGPQMRAGALDGVPNPQWVTRVVSLLSDGKIDDLLNEATSDQLSSAGNVAGEILNWIAMLGVLGKQKPRFIEPQLQQGHAYAIWRWD
jgi:gallate dioxygenase